MKSESPKTVKFSEETQAGLKRISEALGIAQTVLISKAVDLFVQRIEREGELRIKLNANSEAGGTNSDFLLDALQKKSPKKATGN